jgi:hypothetical protein
MPMVAVDATNCLSGNDVRTALQPLFGGASGALTGPSRAVKALQRVHLRASVPLKLFAAAEP